MDIKITLPDCPEGREHVVIAKFSGGRSSALACRAAVEAGVADRVVFNNTGLESGETYEFLDAVNREWLDGRLEFLERRGETRGEEDRIERPASAAACSQLGQPMSDLVAAYQLPSALQRSCTKMLKVYCTFRALYEDGLDHRSVKVTSVIGFRSDEPARLARMRSRNEAIEERERAGMDYLKWTDSQTAPLADAGIGRQAVLEEFRRRPLKGLSFDPCDERVRLSNCVGCFFSGQGELRRVAREEPFYAEFWDRLERRNFESRGERLGERPGRAAALARRGLEPADAFERNGYSLGAIPWSAVMREVDRDGEPVVQEDLFVGGCGDGECGVDL